MVNEVNQQQTLNTTVYEFDHFSGSQISIYIGDILVDDISSVQFTVTQSKRPIYGYASQYYSTVAPGQVIVEGMFTVPFKESDYILATLAQFQEKMVPISKTSGSKQVEEDLILNVDAEVPDYYIKKENIERYLERGKGVADLDTYRFVTDLGALSDQAFENIAEKFEDLLWQDPDQDFLKSNLTRYQPGEDHFQYRRGDQYPPFDIWVLYGDVANSAANHTIKRLVDVEIIGQGQAIGHGQMGEPIIEVYRFIAKNLV